MFHGAESNSDSIDADQLDDDIPSVMSMEADEPLTDDSTCMDIAPDLAPVHVDSNEAASLGIDGEDDLDALVAYLRTLKPRPSP